jgi:hypothetical protein
MGEPGNFAVEGYGPEDQMERKLVFVNKGDAVGGQRGDPGFAGKSIAGGHLITRGHFHKQVLFCIPFEDLQQPEIIRKNDQTMAFFPEDLEQIKTLVAMKSRENTAEIGVSIPVLDKQDSAPSTGYNLAPYNGLHAKLFCCLDKKNESIEPVGVGQGKSMHAQVLGGPAELMDGPDPPAFGIVGVDVEVNERHGPHTLRLPHMIASSP